MAEYIERAAAVKVVLRERKPTNSVAQNRMLSTIQRDLLTMCAADVAPVVHGRWEHGYYCYEPATQCSVCKVCLAKGHRAEKQFTYCPNCGAKMDGGADHADD